MPIEPSRLDTLSALAKKVLWLSSWTIHNANHIRPDSDGLKVGGHQASSASLASIMSALYFGVLKPQDFLAVKRDAGSGVGLPSTRRRITARNRSPTGTTVTAAPGPAMGSR